MVAGGMVMLVARLGWKKALALGVLGLPLLVVAFGGRQTNFNFSEDDTGHGRVEIWRDVLGMFKADPVFGAGYGQISETLRIVAHNSFLHSFTELGFGGALFLGAFYVPVWFLRQRGGTGQGGRSDPDARQLAVETPTDRELRRWRPCVLAVIASYGLGLCSLSRAYTVTTYLILGIASAYHRLGRRAPDVVAPAPLPAVLGRVAAMSVLFLVFVFLFVRVVT